MDKYVQIEWRHPSVANPEHEIMLKFTNGLREKLAFYARTRKTGDIAEALNLDI